MVADKGGFLMVIKCTLLESFSFPRSDMGQIRLRRETDCACPWFRKYMLSPIDLVAPWQ